ncbi:MULTISPECIES: serine/threonine protein kinase [unclassified Coleofasciculus]|uniref:serine/threonine protein kinase n=1 Tax=unclassified Coleofasciculus TaxID=2692782 RepID=UPI001881D37A|nr:MULTISPECIES: serine/threonine-protein kinase [unclassified Coleofasciculus]MBE9127437.1 serine/threonine protein kinase [Coleofasciculus sp. LEGE 07081]MBE9149237.1 serine/threonine protein kinase [Coleofasciculus sp. LEGE 07092]
MLQTAQVLQERYRLQRQLGNNAGRQTWLAKDIQTSPAEPVTLKLLAFSPQMQWEEFKLFEREASILKQLNHPRIPRYRDYFSLDKQTGAGLCWFGLVQDYIPGYSLQQLIDSGKRFTEVQVRSIATQVLKILSYLHGLNPPVLHRDIKPSNLILGKDKRVYLVDFGAVQDSAAVEGVTFTVVGTTGYAPLEQFWGQAVPASDLYALGATLIHLLTGISPAELPQNNLRIQFRDRVSINPTFLNWIEALTEPDLDLRLSTVAQALEALETGRHISYPLETVKPPFNSQIKLKKSPHQLSIKIPGRRRSVLRGRSVLLSIIIVAGKLLPFFSLAIVMLVLSLLIPALVVVFVASVGLLFSSFKDFSVGLLFSFFEDFLAVVFLFSMAMASLIMFWIWGRENFVKMADDIEQSHFSASVFSNCCLEFDRNKFSIEFRQFGRINSHYQGQVSEIKEVWDNPSLKKVFLKTEAKTYCLTKGLTQAERQWLVQEINEWLADV